jgi:hypothetical protein
VRSPKRDSTTILSQRLRPDERPLPGRPFRSSNVSSWPLALIHVARCHRVLPWQIDEVRDARLPGRHCALIEPCPRPSWVPLTPSTASMTGLARPDGLDVQLSMRSRPCRPNSSSGGFLSPSRLFFTVHGVVHLLWSIGNICLVHKCHPSVARDCACARNAIRNSRSRLSAGPSRQPRRTKTWKIRSSVVDWQSSLFSTLRISP